MLDQSLCSWRMLLRSMHIHTCTMHQPLLSYILCVQANLQGQISREKALGEAEGRAKEARENEDINRRAALLRYQEEVCVCVGVWVWVWVWVWGCGCVCEGVGV